MSRIRDIAKFLGKTEETNTDNSALEIEGDGEGVGITVYNSVDSLPTTGLTSGDQAWIESSGRLYISNGSGWYNVALINQAPYWDSEPLTTYTIEDSATPLIIRAKARDSDNSDNNLLHQSSASDSAAFLVDITRDSSVFTFTPKSQDSIGASVTAGDLTDSDQNDFIYTFKWSDGISFVSKAVTINYNFATYTVATGGTITEYSSGGVDYRVHSFLSGTTNFTVSTLGDDDTIALLLVGGGGGGGGGFAVGAAGGGGGAGAFRQIASHTITAQTYSIVVGNGGAGGVGSPGVTSRSNGSYGAQDGSNGSNTTAFGYTANGGGGGTSYYDIVGRANGNASGGGNGGAGGLHNNTGTSRASGGTYGSAGGLQAGTGQSNGTTSCGGGGGAGGQGGDGSSNGSGGNGGVGAQNNYRTGSNVYYAGGGGGGHAGQSSKTPASGGNGGGGSAGSDNSNGVNGSTNTGGGGGGASSQSTTVTGGTGGSGIVVVRYVI